MTFLHEGVWARPRSTMVELSEKIGVFFYVQESFYIKLRVGSILNMFKNSLKRCSTLNGTFRNGNSVKLLVKMYKVYK